MKKEEYLEGLDILKKEFERKKRDLALEFAKSNSTAKIGDKVTDHIGSIIIESMGLSSTLGGIPCMTYYGHELKKDGSIRKDKSKRRVLQMNLIKLESNE